MGSHPVGYTLDAAGLLAILGALLGWISPIAALIAILWYSIQIWESRTVQTWVQKRHERRLVRLAAKLAALQLRTAASAASMELKGAAQAAAQTLRQDAKKAVSDAEQAPKSIP
jgi:hypothetical protein